MPKEYRARHILLEYKEDADYVLKQLNTGADFSELAKEYSECNSSEQGGDLGRFLSGQMVPEFERALSKLAEDEVSGPIKTKFGYHIIQRLKI